MSTTYPDLPLTQFPGSVDQFKTFLDVTASDGTYIQQYMQALQQNDLQTAQTVMAQIPAASQKLVQAMDLNQLTQAMMAVERFYSTDIYPYIQTQQQNWQAIVNQFSYISAWAPNTTYDINNMVSYSSGGSNLIYIAIDDVPVNVQPTNTQYWRQMTIQGESGGAGPGLSYLQDWNSSTQYVKNNAVTYDGAIWMALKTNTGTRPGTSSSTWQKIISFTNGMYPVQATQPSGLGNRQLWFNTSGNPTNYVYLAPLSNPAQASDIPQGLQAYDMHGNLIVGTAT